MPFCIHVDFGRSRPKMTPSQTSQLLSKLFDDPKTGFVGADKLLRRAKQHNPKITLVQVKEFLVHNPIHQVFQKPTLAKTQPRIHGKVGHYQADLTFLTRYKKHNSNYHNVINVNTKYAYVEALRDKTQESVVNAFENIRLKAARDGKCFRPTTARNFRTCGYLTGCISIILQHSIARRATLNALEWESDLTEPSNL